MRTTNPQPHRPSGVPVDHPPVPGASGPPEGPSRAKRVGVALLVGLFFLAGRLAVHAIHEANKPSPVPTRTLQLPTTTAGAATSPDSQRDADARVRRTTSGINMTRSTSGINMTRTTAAGGS